MQPHFFSLGGALETARWLQALRAGAFDLTDDGSGLITREASG
jgi:hypothetical protein